MQREAYCVSVRHNLVVSVGPVELSQGQELPDSNLAVGSLLAGNNREHGCLDGDYLFASLHDAKDFAVLSLEYLQRVLEHSLSALQQNNFYAAPRWRNPHVPEGGGGAG